MTVELNTLAPKKWVADYSGVTPTIDVDDDVLVGDFAIDNSTTPYYVWQCMDNTSGAPVWIRVNVDWLYSVTGLRAPSDYSISYSAATRQFTVVNSGTTVSVNGVVTVPADETTAAHADTTAQYWAVYASGATTLTITTTPSIDTQAIVGRIYYNTDQGAAKAIEFEERHSQEFSGKLHESLHQTVGARIVTSPLGCAMADYILDNSTNDASIEFSLAAGEMYDEDIEHAITALASGAYTIGYRAGLDSADRMDWDDSATSPFKMSGTYLDYNELNSGTWGQTELTSNDRVNYFVFAWTRSDNTRDIVIFQGQQVHSSLEAAQGEEPGDLQLPSYLAPEQVPLFRVTFRCRVNYTGTTGNCRIEAVTDFRGTISGAQVVSGNTVDHQSLSNRDAIGAHPATAVSVDAAAFALNLSTADINPQLAFATLDAKRLDNFLLTAATELTIAAGAITVTTGNHTVDTESDDAADDLATISGGVSGHVYMLTPANAARVVTIKHGTGNILCSSGADVVLVSAVFLWYDGTSYRMIGDGGGGGGGGYPADGRLTLESGVPVSSTDQTAKTSVYYTPYIGNQIALYDGSSAWTTFTFTELTQSLAMWTADKNYDMFVYDNSGTVTLTFLVWTNDTTRATALVRQDGVLVLAGTTTHRYVGTIRTTGSTGQCEDSKQKRLVWNMYNRKSRLIYALNDTYHSYTTGTWRRYYNDDSTKVEWVMGLQEELLDLACMAGCSQGGGKFGMVVNTANYDPDAIREINISDGWEDTHMLHSFMPDLGYGYALVVHLGSSGDSFYNGKMQGAFRS